MTQKPPRLIFLIGVCVFAIQLNAQDVSLAAAIPGSTRLKDIGGQLYGQAFMSTYSYNSASVNISFDTGIPQPYLSGTLTATGLKPNFAYQIKLIGRPSKEAVTAADLAAADDATNEMIGRMGRWWRVTPNPGNAEDAEYDANKNDPSYIYEGYLVMSFFVTDSLGNASLHFLGNNSFHVLWRIDQRTPGPNDGPPQAFTLPDTTGNTAYDVSVAARQYSLYGEWQPTRALPGTLQMTDGHYRCNLLLTEESFHDSPPFGGQWSAAMVGPIEFDFPMSVPPKPIGLKSLRAFLNSHRSLNDEVRFNGTLPWGQKTSAGLLVKADLFGISREFTLDSHGRGVSGGSRFVLKASRQDAGTAIFSGTLRRAAFVLPALSADGKIPATLTLTVGTDVYQGSVSSIPKQNSVGETLLYKK